MDERVMRQVGSEFLVIFSLSVAPSRDVICVRFKISDQEKS